MLTPRSLEQALEQAIARGTFGGGRATSSSVAGWLSVGVVFGVLGVGCAAAPPGPRGPLSEPGAQFALDWSVAVGKGRLARPGKAASQGTADY